MLKKAAFAGRRGGDGGCLKSGILEEPPAHNEGQARRSLNHAPSGLVLGLCKVTDMNLASWQQVASHHSPHTLHPQHNCSPILELDSPS